MQLINPTELDFYKWVSESINSRDRYPLNDEALEWERWIYCDTALLKDIVLKRKQATLDDRRYLTLNAYKYPEIKIPENLVLIDQETAKLWSSFTYYLKVCEGVTLAELSEQPSPWACPKPDDLDNITMWYLSGGSACTPHQGAEDLFGLVAGDSLAELRNTITAVVSAMAIVGAFEIPLVWKNVGTLTRVVHDFFSQHNASAGQSAVRPSAAVVPFPKRQ